MKSKKGLIFIAVLFTGLLSPSYLLAEKRGKIPTVAESPTGERLLTLSEDLDDFLLQEFPGYQIPKESDFNPQMLNYYHSRLVGIHPAIAWGDFNGDKRRDYALLIVTGQSPWGPLVELVILNGLKKSNQFEVFRIGEVYGFKDDYVSFEEGKLYKGKFQRGGWHINWDPKKQTYVKLKS